MIASLGSIANKSSQREKQRKQRASKEYQKRLALRYKRQNTARRLLRRAGMVKHRTCDCMRKAIPTQVIELVRQGDTAHYRGLQACGSVWSCPVCSAQITERRRKQLQAGVEKLNYFPVMVTCTLSHSRTQSLRDVNKQLLTAWKRLTSGAWWAGDRRRGAEGIKRMFGLDHWIRSLEVTYGHENGWHPHLHVLFLLPRSIGADDLELLADFLKERWAEIVASLGGWATLENGIDVTAGNDALAKYVAKTGLDTGHEIKHQNKALDGKWTVVHELTKAPAKSSAGDRYSPNQLLDLADKNAWAGNAWVEYSDTMRGHKQLNFSAGCKDLLGIDDLTEEELAELDDVSNDESTEIVEITADEWKQIMQWNEKRMASGREDIRSVLVKLLMRWGAKELRQRLTWWFMRF
jgi:hypothetical protein